MADELSTTIRDNAAGPAKAAGDVGSVEQHDLEKLLKVQNRLGSNQAVKKRRFGLRILPGQPGSC